MRKPTKRKTRSVPFKPTCEERLGSLERRVTAIEATLNGKLSRIEETLASSNDGIKVMQDCNYYIVRELQDARHFRGQEPSEQLARVVERGAAWKAKQETDGDPRDV